MKQGFIKTAAATPKVVVADCRANGEEILKLVHEMAEKHVKIMVFPELSITGATCQDLFLHRRLIDSAWETLLWLVDETKDVDALICAGLPMQHAGKLYNAAAVWNKGKILGFVPKTVIANSGEGNEQRYFVSGEGCFSYVEWDDEKVPFGTELLFECKDVPELKVAVEIGDDLFALMPTGTWHAMAGATIMAYMSAACEYVTKRDYRKSMIGSQSARLVCGYVCANAGNGESTQDLVFGGGNVIMENGKALAEAEMFTNGYIISEIDVQNLVDERKKNSGYPAADMESHVCVPFVVEVEETELTRKLPVNPFVPESMEECNKRCAEILNIQAMGLKKRMEHIHCEKAIVGLSGGLDSTLALLVIAKTMDIMGLPRENIHCVTMPCFGTTDRTYNNACKLSERLGARLSEVNIRKSVQQHFEDIGHDMEVHDVTFENSQARERTQILMDMGNQENALLVGTGDLSELVLGWATYNGDHMSMYAVNGSVPKTLVRHVCRYYAETCGDEELKAVLFDILDTPVSPELLPPKDGEIAQKTEDLVGPYEIHDYYLFYMLRHGFEPEKIYRMALKAFDGIYDKETLMKWLKKYYWRFFSQQFKRSCLPDGPKVGSVDVSPRGGLHMPSDASVRMWIEQVEKIKY